VVFITLLIDVTRIRRVATGYRFKRCCALISLWLMECFGVQLFKKQNKN